jgi:hypothetical protein
VPKTTHLCTTIVGKARAHLAVALDSVGYENTYSTLFDILGMEYDHDICGGHHKQLDGSKKYNQTYDKKDGAQWKRATAKSMKIREDMRKVVGDKKDGKSYGSGIGGPEEKKKNKKGTERSALQCKHCLKFGHSRKSHQDCGKSTYVKKG